MDPIGDLMEADAYTVVDELAAAAVRMHANNLRYQYCDCHPNIGLMGHKDLMVILGPNTNTNNAVVIVVNTRATKV